MQVLKSKDNLKTIEADLLKTAAKEAKGITKAANMLSKTYKEKDENRLREKLVTKLKQKEINKMEHLVERLQDVRDGNHALLFDSEDVEDISDEELQVKIRIMISRCFLNL